ncbi:MAG: diacylglycerol kinase [Candidatus Omnitrophica bacterium]|nr:diacylglycerol kinase [Candidatus Omnitrophota bacterium]
MQKTNWLESINCAIEGFIYVVKTQRNMRIHFLFAGLVFILGIIMDFTRIELICLGTVTTIVLLAEMINTIIENVIDLISDSFHPLARIIKDVSAGTVLISAISAAISGYLLFSRHLNLSIIGGLSRLKTSSLHFTFIVLIVVFFLVMIGKVLSRKGTPLHGGMPSGHAAISFAIWAIVIFSTSNPLVISLTCLLAAAIAVSRLRGNIHTMGEIISGAVLGFFITVLLFQFFRWCIK